MIIGKFKRLPKGEIYVGGEMSEIVQFGLIGRSIANAAISLTKSLVSGLHYSFGTLNNTNNNTNNNTTDDEDNRIKEKPHLVAPLFLAFDKIIITKENETPPELGSSDYAAVLLLLPVTTTSLLIMIRSTIY